MELQLTFVSNWECSPTGTRKLRKRGWGMEGGLDSGRSDLVKVCQSRDVDDRQCRECAYGCGMQELRCLPQVAMQHGITVALNIKGTCQNCTVTSLPSVWEVGIAAASSW